MASNDSEMKKGNDMVKKGDTAEKKVVDYPESEEEEEENVFKCRNHGDDKCRHNTQHRYDSDPDFSEEEGDDEEEEDDDGDAVPKPAKRKTVESEGEIDIPDDLSSSQMEEAESLQPKKKKKKVVETRQTLLMLDDNGNIGSNARDTSVDMKIQKTSIKSINEMTVDLGKVVRDEVNKYFESLRAKLSIDINKFDKSGNRLKADELIRQSVLTRKIQSNVNLIVSEKKVKLSIGYQM